MPSAMDRIPIPMQAAAARALFALPPRARRRIAGRAVRVDGPELALDAQLLIKLLEMSGTSLVATDPAATRRQMELSTPIVSGKPIQPVAARDLTVPGTHIPGRLYTPEGAASPGPLLVFYHGGGFATGSLATHDNTARFLALHAGVRVLAVDYRLAPEHPFPAAVDDAEQAFAQAHAHAAELGADPDRIAVGGDSAGGNLAAVVAQQAVRGGGPSPAFQLLIYPALDFTRRRPSREKFANGFFLTDESMTVFENHYLTPSDTTDVRASPMLAKDLSGLPPAFLTTAGFDPLRDEGEEYAAALRAAGVRCAYAPQPDLIHGYVNFLGLGTRAMQATAVAAGALRQGLA